MRHTMKVNANTYRVEWPYFKMGVGDFFVIKGKKAKEVKHRAISAAYHYRESYGKWFRADKINDNEFQIIRYK